MDYIWLVLLVYLCFPLHIKSQWSFLSGSQATDTSSDYTTPIIGGLYEHAMVIDNTDRYLYVYGGYGLDDRMAGILINCIN